MRQYFPSSTQLRSKVSYSANPSTLWSRPVVSDSSPTIQLNCWADLVVPWSFALCQRWNKFGTVHLKCLLQRLAPEPRYCDCIYPENEGEIKEDIRHQCCTLVCTTNKVHWFILIPLEQYTFSFCNFSKVQESEIGNKGSKDKLSADIFFSNKLSERWKLPKRCP